MSASVHTAPVVSAIYRVRELEQSGNERSWRLDMEPIPFRVKLPLDREEIYSFAFNDERANSFQVKQGIPIRHLERAEELSTELHELVLALRNVKGLKRIWIHRFGIVALFKGYNGFELFKKAYEAWAGEGHWMVDETLDLG